jgi:O6-methylguanine-DNA--protein-cysteine methyltransferase
MKRSGSSPAALTPSKARRQEQSTAASAAFAEATPAAPTPAASTPPAAESTKPTLVSARAPPAVPFPPLAPSMTRPVTAFEASVLALCKTVPAGHVTTYKAIAERLGCRSMQAVGQALRRYVGAYARACGCTVA